MLKHPRIKTWVMGQRLKPHLFQDLSDLVKPMVWATAKPVQGFLQKTILVTRVCGIPDRGSDHSQFVVREICLAEGILAITLLKYAFFANCF